MLLWPFNHYPGTDYESFNYDWIIGKLKELKNSVAAALASEQAAAASADEAHASVLAATVQATHAKTYATNAANSADSAAESADLALERARMGTIKLGEMPGDTPEEQLQYVLEHYTDAVIEVGNITINNTVPVTASVDVKHLTFVDGVITLNADMLACNTYCPSFSNIVFTGNYYVLANGYVGANFEGCRFKNTGIVNRSSGYIQSFRVIDCDFTGNTKVVLHAPQAIDLEVSGTRFEQGSTTVINIAGGATFNVTHASFTNCLFEGYETHIPIELGSTMDVIFIGCYFEDNRLGSVKFTDAQAYATFINNYFNASYNTAPSIIFTGSRSDRLTLIRNRWTGSQPLTNATMTWNNNFMSNLPVSVGTDMTSDPNSSYWGYTYPYTTFDSDTHTLTINYKCYGELYNVLPHLKIWITGQYGNSATRTGYIDADIYTYITNGLVASAKAVINDGYADANGGQGNISVTLPNGTAPAQSIELVITCDSFTRIDNVVVKDVRAAGSFYRHKA